MVAKLIENKTKARKSNGRQAAEDNILDKIGKFFAGLIAK